MAKLGWSRTSKLGRAPVSNFGWAILGWALVGASASAQDASLVARLLEAQHAAVNDRQFDVSAGLQPLWEFHGGVTILDRVTEDARILMQNVGNPGEQLSADDFNFDWTTGFEGSFIRRWWDNDGFELRFLTTGNVDSMVEVPSTATSLQINAATPIFAPDVTALLGDYETALSSVELNYHHWIAPYATGVIGLRYATLDDDLTILIDSTPEDFIYDVDTRNDLYGLQIGLLGGPRLGWTGLILTADARVGVYANDLRQRSSLDTGAVVLRVRESAENISWLAEAHARAELPITRHVSIRGGYSVYWIDQVAIASDQLLRSDFFTGTGKSKKGAALFHGALIAVELRH